MPIGACWRAVMNESQCAARIAPVTTTRAGWWENSAGRASPPPVARMTAPSPTAPIHTRPLVIAAAGRSIARTSSPIVPHPEHTTTSTADGRRTDRG